MRNSKYSVYTIGAPTIITVLIILCIITFAALSLVSAKADNNLSTQLAENTTNYYSANTKAQSKLQKIDNRIGELLMSGDLESFYKNIAKDEVIGKIGTLYVEGNDLIVDFVEKIDENSQIHVKVKIVPPKEKGECIEIISYKNETLKTWDNDDTINVYIPD